MFSEFSVIIGVDDNSRFVDADQGMIFIVEGDGRIIYRSSSMKMNDSPVNISVNISGVQQLVMRSEITGTGSGRRRGIMGNWAVPLLMK